MDNSRGMKHHFERVASVYDNVRNTDHAIIKAIVPCMPRGNRRVDIADVGCGTGRYSELIAAQLNTNLRLYCCDYSSAMLSQCRKCMAQEYPSHLIDYCVVSANALPFADNSLDTVVTFNAVHHFNLERFITEAARVLRCGGLLAIYTRTPEQNARNIWGQYSPGFTERETRLYRSSRLKEAIDSVSGLRLEDMQEFKHERSDSPESLLERARNFHYSTFSLYPPDEFTQALETFAKRLDNLSNDGIIKHSAKNTLVLARRI